MKPIPSTSRKASREFRRQQLIEATIATIAERGYAQTTLSDVARAAGVSHGLLIFHFESKEKLLTETLLFMAEEYRANWMAALADANDNPAAQLNALLVADFNDVVCTPQRVSAWCAFWGEAASRPIYQEHCGANDLEYIAMKQAICERLVRDGNYAIDAAQAARVLRVTSEGVWLDLLSSPAPHARDEGLKTVMFCAAAFFADHFGPSGLRR
jgi:AcrR family transcriptional regulator